MTTITRVQGDQGDTVTVTLAGITDLTTAASVAAYVKQGDTTATLSASIPDENEPVVLVALGGSSGWLKTAAAGLWNLEVQVTFGDSSVLTWPSDKPIELRVRSQVG